MDDILICMIFTILNLSFLYEGIKEKKIITSMAQNVFIEIVS